MKPLLKRAMNSAVSVSSVATIAETKVIFSPSAFVHFCVGPRGPALLIGAPVAN